MADSSHNEPSNSSMIVLKNNKKLLNLSMDSNRLHSVMNSSLVDIISKNEEFDQQYRTNKLKKIELNANNLYMLSFVKKEKNQMISQEYNKVLAKREKDICSFKPNLIIPKKEIESEILKLNFVERRDQIKQKIYREI